MTLDEIKHLIEFIREQDLSEFELEQDGMKIRIKSGAVSSSVPLPAPAVGVPASPGVPSAPDAEVLAALTPPVSPAALEDAPELAIVKSPIVGTFYLAPEPTAKNFVEIGDSVKKEQVLCIIEAMKIMNEIECEFAGVVREANTQDAQPVEYGQVLFRIDPNG